MAASEHPGQRPSASCGQDLDGPRRGRAVAARARTIAPGLALALAVAAVATVVGEYVPLVGSAVPGAVIGAVIALAVKPGARLAPGLK